MYLHNQDWPAAMRVAERCEPGAVDDIYLAQVRCLIVLHTCMLGVELWYLLPHHTSPFNLGVCQLASVTRLRKPAVSGKLHLLRKTTFVCLLQAVAASSAQQWQEAESYFLKAKRPDAALTMYREAGQWQAALKLAEAYLPNSVQVRCASFRARVV